MDNRLPRQAMARTPSPGWCPLPLLAPAPDKDAGTPLGERRRGFDRRNGADRRAGRDDRRGGRRDPRPAPVERRAGTPERRSGRPSRRLGGDRRRIRGAPNGPPPVDPDVLFWVVNVVCWAAVTAVVLVYGL
jgi:hypothetical protein